MAKYQYVSTLETPTFTQEDDVESQQRNFEEFLFNIFDYPLEKAYRRNRFYWGERYERKKKIGNEFYWLCRKVIPLRDAKK